MSRLRLFFEWLAILACSCLIVWWAAASDLTHRLDVNLLDLAAVQRASPASEDTLIVALDDRSVQALGRWPWDRKLTAALIDRLHAAGARAIVLDILLAEPSTPESDAALEKAIAASGRVALAHSFTAPENRQSGFDPLLPMPSFAAHALAVGHVGLDPDEDGTVRSVPVVLQDAGRVFPHLQLAAMRALGENVPQGTDGLESAIVPLRPAGAYRSVPAASVISGEVPAAFIRGRVVMVGATAAGLGDRHPVSTFVGSMMPGVELQANLRDALRRGEFIRPVAQPLWLAGSWLVVILLFIGFWRLRPAMCLVLSLVLAATLLLGTFLLASCCGLWFAPGPALAAILAAYPLWGWRRLAAVSDFLDKEARRLAPVDRGDRSATTIGGFDNVAKQVSRLQYLVEDVAERREFLTTVIEAAPDAICVFGSDNRLQLMNQRARDIFGESPGQVAYVDLVDSAGGELLHEGRELKLDDGSVFSVAASRSGSEGGLGGIRVIAFSDITEMRRAEEERRQMLEFLSHDMRSPQVAILGLAGKEAGSAPAERFERIGGHARRTLKLADDFVQLSRLAEVPLELEETDLVMLAEEAIDRAWFAAREKGVRLVQELPEEPVFRTVDGHVLSRALDNLIGNAIRYSPAGSAVTIAIATTAGGVAMSVTDEGPGLPEERRADPFRRFGSRDKYGKGGAGLGLSFVRAAVEKHGATIASASSEAGTTFTITF